MPIYSNSKIRSLLNQATSTLNTRPMLKLDCGRILTPFDIISLTQLAGGAPFQSLQSHSDDKKIQGKIKDFENMKRNIQMEIFNKYIEHIFLYSGRRQKGNFSLDSKYLETGDILLLNFSFKHSKNQWEGHPLPDADTLDLQPLYNQLNTSTPVTSNTIKDINDEALEIMSQTFLEKEAKNSVTTPKEEEGSCVQLDDTTQTTTVFPEKDLLPKTRKGRIIKRPVRFGFDD